MKPPNGSTGDKMPKKRIRRTANEINRRFICACGKAYGSEGSLNQHKKNKGHYQDALIEGQEGMPHQGSGAQYDDNNMS